MPVTMSGMASGIDTDGIIEKLLKVEREPIRQLEISKQLYNGRKDGLDKLKNQLEDINKAAQDLYGFRASFDDKKAISSDPTSVDAEASKKAKEGLTKIKVVKIASTHKIATDSIEGEKKLPEARFKIEVNGQSAVVKFGGGKLKSLKEKIDEAASEFISTSMIKTGADEYVLTLESKVPGEKGEMLISGDKDFLKSIGMIKGAKDEDKREIALIFDKRYFSSYAGEKKIGTQSGSIDVGKEGQSITMKGLLWQEYNLPARAEVRKDTIFTVKFSYNKKTEEEELIPNRVELGPEERTVIKGIELKGYNVSRIRKEEEKQKEKDFDSILGVGVVYTDNGKRFEKIYSINKDSKGDQEIPIGRDFADKSVEKVIFYCNDGVTSFSDAKISTPLEGKDLLEPKNPIIKAENAKLKVDGIDVDRDRNDGLTDIIEGVTINIKSPSRDDVSIKIDYDVEKSIEKIRKFVEAYNKYLDLNKSLTKTEKTTKPGEGNMYDRGLFVGDMTIVSIESNLRRLVNNAYTSRADNPIKMFPQIGVSTGEINASWETIKDGKLIVNDSEVDKTIRENPEGVKMFFGSDTDGDSKVDSGMAYSVVMSLKPYLSYGKNIIATKVDLEDENIKQANERIGRQEEHLKKYEQKLRQKFASMEKAISGAKSQQNWMKQQSGQEEK